MDFNTWKEFYSCGFATIEQLKEAVKEGMLTVEQFKEITGEDYITSAKVISTPTNGSNNSSIHSESAAGKESLIQKIFN